MIWFLLETTNTKDREILIQHRKLRPATLITGATTRNGTKKFQKQKKNGRAQVKQVVASGYFGNHSLSCIFCSTRS